MLVKVNSGSAKWILFDNAEQVEYLSLPFEITSSNSLEHLSQLHQASEVVHILPGIDVEAIDKSHKLRVGIITFFRNQEKYLIIFSTLAYICNDSGKTVEKVQA